MALVPQMVDAVRMPVIAAGGIMDGRGIAAALMLGAAGVQMGTAFLSSPESGISAGVARCAARRAGRFDAREPHLFRAPRARNRKRIHAQAHAGGGRCSSLPDSKRADAADPAGRGKSRARANICRCGRDRRRA